MESSTCVKKIIKRLDDVMFLDEVCLVEREHQNNFKYIMGDTKSLNELIKNDFININI